MSFEALSCAMARVIVNYHACKTKASLLPSEDLDTLEKMLNCTTEQIDSKIEDKIDNATTGVYSDSSRRTFLQYMHFGVLLARKAARAETPDEIRSNQTQLTNFIQNLQRLLTTTTTFSIWPRSLSVPIEEGESLSIALLSYTNADAKTLLLDFFTVLELSQGSTETEIQSNIRQRFENHALSIQNKALKTQLEELNQKASVLTTQFDLLAKKKSKPATQSQSVAAVQNFEDEKEDFEYISLASETEKERLMKAHDELSQNIEGAEKRILILQKLIDTHSNKQTGSKFAATESLASLHARTKGLLSFNGGAKAPNNDAEVVVKQVTGSTP
ncbi:MAG: hypothetical protein P1U36_08995 [Legionellaceae bacterium]|nr:hypothetical protein [Legionellaceae bacterium]